MSITTTPPSTVSPNLYVSQVQEGNDYSANIVPDAGKKIIAFKKDGITESFNPSGQTYEILDVQQNHVLDVYMIDSTKDNAFWETTNNIDIDKDNLAIDTVENGAFANSTKTYQTASIAHFQTPNLVETGVWTWTGTSVTVVNNPDGSQNVSAGMDGATTNESVSVAFEAFADYQAFPNIGNGNRLQIIRGDGYTVGLTADYRNGVEGLVINNMIEIFGQKWSLQSPTNSTGLGTWGIRVLTDGTIEVKTASSNTWREISLFTLEWGVQGTTPRPQDYTKIPPANTTFQFNVIHAENAFRIYQNITLPPAPATAQGKMSFGLLRSDGDLVKAKYNNGNWNLIRGGQTINFVDIAQTGRINIIRDLAGDVIFRLMNGTIAKASQIFSGFTKIVPSASSTHEYRVFNENTTAVEDSVQANYAECNLEFVNTPYKMVFDGINDFMTFPQTSILQPIATANAMTFETWIMYPSIPNGTIMGVSGNYNAPQNDATFSLFADFRSGMRNFRIDYFTTTSGFYQTLFTNIQANTWYRLAVCLVAGTIQAYINGNRVFNASYTGNLRFVDVPLYVGRWGVPHGGIVVGLGGQLYETALHNAARYTGTSYDHTQPVTLDSNTIMYLPPMNATDNIVINEGTGEDGTLFGVTTHTDFYKER